ncbi:MAG: hypothetical protein NTX73_03890 [Rhodobacterales bacterium]|nr:hypothetical protein [Rhodobacterales bacterium]
MTNGLAYGIGTFVIAALLLDYVFFGGNGALFLAKKGMDFLEWIAFWR